MKVSTKVQYGMLALTDIALYSENGSAVSGPEIAERQDGYLLIRASQPSAMEGLKVLPPEAAMLSVFRQMAAGAGQFVM